jgi:acetyl-CoA acetyltransferase
MNHDIAIVGIGETPPLRRSQKTLKAMVIDACRQALDDAGIGPDEVDGIVTDAGLMPLTVGHDYVAGQLGIERRWDGALSYGAAAHCCAPLLAQGAINAGLAKIILHYFGVDWGSRLGGPYAFHDIYPSKMAFEKPYGFNSQPLYFGFWANRFIYEHNLDASALAWLAVTQREHALLNGNAQINKPLSFDD